MSASCRPTGRLDGYHGRYVDIAQDPAWPGICTAAPSDVTMLYGEAESSGRGWGALVGHRERAIFLDLEAGRPIMILISARDELFDDLLAEAMPIVESFRFE